MRWKESIATALVASSFVPKTDAHPTGTRDIAKRDANPQANVKPVDHMRRWYENNHTPHETDIIISVTKTPEVKAPAEHGEEYDSRIAKRQDVAHSAKEITMDDCRRMVPLIIEHSKQLLKILSHHPEIVKEALDTIHTDPEARKLYQSVLQEVQSQLEKRQNQDGNPVPLDVRIEEVFNLTVALGDETRRNMTEVKQDLYMAKTDLVKTNDTLNNQIYDVNQYKNDTNQKINNINNRFDSQHKLNYVLGFVPPVVTLGAAILVFHLMNRDTRKKLGDRITSLENHTDEANPRFEEGDTATLLRPVRAHTANQVHPQRHDDNTIQPTRDDNTIQPTRSAPGPLD